MTLEDHHHGPDAIREKGHKPLSWYAVIPSTSQALCPFDFKPRECKLHLNGLEVTIASQMADLMHGMPAVSAEEVGLSEITDAFKWYGEDQKARLGQHGMQPAQHFERAWCLHVLQHLKHEDGIEPEASPRQVPKVGNGKVSLAASRSMLH